MGDPLFPLRMELLNHFAQLLSSVLNTNVVIYLSR